MKDYSQDWNYWRRLFRKHCLLMLTFFMVTLAVVLIGTFIQTPVYRGTATVLIDRETPTILAVSTTKDESVVGQMNYLAYADYYRTQLQIITSRAIAMQVQKNLGLAPSKADLVPETFSEGMHLAGRRVLGQILTGLEPFFPGLRGHLLPLYAQEKNPVETLLKKVRVEPVKQTQLAKIHALDTDPKRAARIANEFATVFVGQNLARAEMSEGITLMKNELLKFQSKESELSKRYGPRFPALVRVRLQINQLIQAIEQEKQLQLYRVQQQKAQVAGPQTSLEASRGLRPNNIQIVDLAEPPSQPAKPNLFLNLFLGFVIALLGAVGSGVFMELLDITLKTPGDVEEGRQFVLLGSIPLIEEGFFGGGTKRYRYMGKQPQSIAAEAFRGLRTSFIYGLSEEDQNAIVFTSAASGEGKTMTAANLAITFAQFGLKTLLVDADLRKPRLHEVFDLKQSPGLSEFLKEKVSFGEILHSVQPYGLTIVTSGSLPRNAAELLGSSRMEQFLKEAERQFAWVLLDAPPALAVTDPILLAAKTGKIVTVVRSGMTPRQALSRVVSSASDVKAKMLGVILNGVTLDDMKASYSGYAYGYAS